MRKTVITAASRGLFSCTVDNLTPVWSFSSFTQRHPESLLAANKKQLLHEGRILKQQRKKSLEWNHQVLCLLELLPGPRSCKSRCSFPMTCLGWLVCRGLCPAHSVAWCFYDGNQQFAQGGRLWFSPHTEEVWCAKHVGQCPPTVAIIAAAPGNQGAWMVLVGRKRGAALYQPI